MNVLFDKTHIFCCLEEIQACKKKELSGLENHKYYAQKICYPCNIINLSMPNKTALITCQLTSSRNLDIFEIPLVTPLLPMKTYY